MPPVRDGQFLSVHYNCAIAPAPLMDALPNYAAVMGASSCLGAMTDQGLTSGLAAFLLEDPEGDFGTGLAALSDDPMAAAAKALQIAQARADRLGEIPDLIWVASTPGQEEAVLKGLISVVGPDVPIIGGSAADNDVSGGWSVFDRDQSQSQAVVVGVLYSSGQISFAYHNGYAPTRKSAVVTKSEGRVIWELDNRPATQVYSELTGAAVPCADVTTPTAILSQSTLWPLGREINSVGGVPYYLLAHPATARPDGAIEMFATVAEGEVLTQMTGSRETLTARAGRVAALAQSSGPIAATDIKGALMIYCGGCMLSVQDHLGDVIDGVREALPGVPFLGAFTFGEQGQILGAGNRHGNLMISCIVFG